jgi:AraC-like DNA-binding protein
MPHTPVTIPIAFVHGVLSGAQARGQSIDAFLSDAGISLELLQQGNARVTAEQYAALVRSLTTRLDDELLGFLSCRVKRGSLALIARSALGARSLEVASRRIAHTVCLLQDDVMLEPAHAGSLSGWTLRFTELAVGRLPFLQLLLMRVLWRALAWFAGGRLAIARVDFCLECSHEAENFSKIFPGRMEFGHPRPAIWFDAVRLQDPVRQDEAALRAFLADTPGNMIVPRHGNDELGARVRRHLLQAQPLWPDLVATAEALHMAPSTLQRHLANHKTTFKTLKNELRCDIAITHLNTSNVSLAELAYELGFSDRATFQRAFRAWTGSAPGAYRRWSKEKLTAPESQKRL